MSIEDIFAELGMTYRDSEKPQVDAIRNAAREIERNTKRGTPKFVQYVQDDGEVISIHVEPEPSFQFFQYDSGSSDSGSSDSGVGDSGGGGSTSDE